MTEFELATLSIREAALWASYGQVAISAAQVAVVCWGILLMRRMSDDRKLDAEARDRQTAEYAREARERHDEAGQRHQEAMAALTALIQRTAAPGTS